ncbi:serine hydrolase domain-containing protein [Winogradskyella forsetii]|uniref:serine hydrolase domain-containing protein n=1 Tax=Winogradskyella forsetii TaxID=2686077 RepID=UPI0015BD8D5F|nr:serine hydrolase domain-containing protein [Winogradskyella forsetii]
MRSITQFAIVCFFTACFFCCKTETNTETKTEADTYNEFISNLKAKGIATGNILVYKDGNVIHKSSNGLRSINPLDSLDFNSQFRLASVSKQFTGMAIMKLKEMGKLDYDQKVNTILTDFPYDNITIRQLLHHTSGLTDYERLIAENFVKADTAKTYILGNDEILKAFYSVDPELDFQPGERFEYSNTGYLVLATIVEKLSGQHFREFLKEQITDPVGMTNTTLYKYQIKADPKMPNRVFGHQLALNQQDLIPNDYNIVNDVRGDGGIFSTLEDLYKWNLALANHTVISKDYLDEAWTPGTLNNGAQTNYGFGWFIDNESNKPKTVFHSGGWVGFITFLHNEIETKSGFIILTNNTSNDFGTIISGISNIREGKPYELPKTQIAMEMAKRILTEDTSSAISFFQSKKTDTLNYKISENDLNVLGYRLLNEDELDAALSVFKLNIEEHPNSANPYDSYGDALLMKGDSVKALENFKKCFEMDSTLVYAKDKSEKLEAALKK